MANPDGVQILKSKGTPDLNFSPTYLFMIIMGHRMMLLPTLTAQISSNKSDLPGHITYYSSTVLQDLTSEMGTTDFRPTTTHKRFVLEILSIPPIFHAHMTNR